jgi:hypothetical protein
VLHDWRLRECDYGIATGCWRPGCTPVGASTRTSRIRAGSWRHAAARVSWLLADLPLRWNGQPILVIGHVATQCGLDHYLGGVPLEDPIEQGFAWQEGWEYRDGYCSQSGPQPAQCPAQNYRSTIQVPPCPMMRSWREPPWCRIADGRYAALFLAG